MKNKTIKKYGMLFAFLLSIVSISSLSAASITLQEGVNGYMGTEDTMIYSGTNAGKNSGGSANLYLGKTTSSNIEAKVLLRFDLSSLSGLVGTIDSVTLTMRYVSGTQTQNIDLNLYQIQSANAGWGEGSKNLASPDIGDATWNYKNYSTTSWAGSAGLSTPGTDYVNSAIDGTKTITTSTAAGTYFTWTLPISLIESWINDPASNAGLLFAVSNWDDLTNVDYFRFGSSEHGTASYRPTLTINYTAIPEPRVASLVLFGLLGLLARRRTI